MTKGHRSRTVDFGDGDSTEAAGQLIMARVLRTKTGLEAVVTVEGD